MVYTTFLKNKRKGFLYFAFFGELTIRNRTNTETSTPSTPGPPPTPVSTSFV